MLNVTEETNRYGLDEHGLDPEGDVFWNLPPAMLYEHSLAADDGLLMAAGALSVNTAPYTGRAPKDRYVVEEPGTADEIWWGDVNVPLARDNFDGLRSLVADRLNAQDVYVQDVRCGADPEFAIRVRVVSESPWHSLFARNMFLPAPEGPEPFKPDWTVLHTPSVTADPAEFGLRSEIFVVIHFGRREVIIGGTRYAGEIKKSIFSVMNQRLPHLDVLPMHCSANVGSDGDVALFFGLSGTGKTTLSTDPDRPLIGDDEHGWSSNGVFNFEGGSYAKVIRISSVDEPLIFRATHRFGTIIENVVLDPVTRVPDFDDDSVTENTRSSYPLEFLGNIVEAGRAGHAQTVMFLAADAFGVLPPISRLNRSQAMYYFLSGYTAKVAGTERGVKEPQATFSPCFGAPFLPLPPAVYADLLGKRIDEHDANVWLVNTGWSGGGYGVGERMPIRYTRAMLHAALRGDLDDVPVREHPVFGVAVPEHIDGVPDEILLPRGTWKDADAYDQAAHRLARMFRDNFRAYADTVPDDVRNSGPRTDA